MGMRILLGISLIVLVALVLQVSGDLLDSTYDPANMRTDDTVAYWTAARLNLQGQNPYDPEQVMALQRSIAGRSYGLFFFDLPYELSILAVFGALPFPFARMVWLMLNLILFILASDWVWVVYAGYERRWIAWIVMILFLPVSLTLYTGQNIAFIVLGASLFLLGAQNKQHWLVGLGIALMAVKPNLYWLLWPALLLFGKQKTIVCTMVWVVFFMAAAILTNPVLPMQFIESFGHLPIWLPGHNNPYLTIVNEIDWIRFLSMIPGMLWFVWYMNRHQLNTWQEIFPDLILASFVCAPYGFAYSLAALLPVVIQTVATCDHWLRSLLSLIPIMAIVALPNLGLVKVIIVTVCLCWWRNWYNPQTARPS